MTNRQCRRVVSLALGCMLSLAFQSWVVLAQERAGNLSGTVKDQTGGLLPDVNVTITNKETNRSLTVKTDTAGTYTIRELDPGRYTVKFELIGFSNAVVHDVILLLGKNIEVNTSMQVGAVEQTVEVSGAATLIDTLSTTVSHNVTAEEFNRLPKARSFQGLALTSPSVNSGEIEGGFQVNGASGAENNFTIDGISTTSLVDGKSRQNAVFEFLQEVQIKTGGIEAEYGGALGGVISAVTKSGGNSFHGEFHYYNDNKSFLAGPVERLVLSPVDNQSVGYFQDHKNKNTSHEVGGSLGGFLIKDKLYFFTSVSPRWRRTSNDYLFSSGTEPDTLQRKALDMQMFNKLSWDPTSRIRTNFSWLYTPTYSTGSLPAYNGFLGNAVSSSKAANETNKVRGFYQPQSSYTGSVDLVLTSNSLLSFRGGYFWDNYHDTGVPSISSVVYQTPSPEGVGLPANLQGGVGFQNTPRVQVNEHDLVTRGFISADYSKVANFLGTHNLKAGTGLQKTVNNVDLSYPGRGYVFVWWDRAFDSLVPGVPAAQRGTYGYYEVNDVGTIGSTGANIIHMYIQDQWRVHPRLSLSLGLRTEKERVPSFSRAVKDFAFEFGFGDKIAPRVGASFDVYGNGKLKIYGSWGRFFDWTKYELSRGTYGGDVWTTRYRSLDTLDVFSLSGTNTPGRNLWSSDPNSFQDHRVPGFNDTDPDLRPMSQDVINAGIEYQFAPEMVFKAHYVHTNLRDTIEDIGSLIDGNEVYIYGNPGKGLGTEMFITGSTPPTNNPEAERKYDAMELSLTRRFSRGWFGSAGYTYSRLYGNYAGLANSDEIRTPTLGISSPQAQASAGTIARGGGNATRGWDQDALNFDSRGNLLYGRLATDRPHVFKLYGSYLFRFGTEIGGFFYGGSGTPVSTEYWNQSGIPLLVFGRGDLGRTPFFTETNLQLAHEVKLGEVKRLRFEFNMLNVFNQKTARHIFPSVNRNRASSRIRTSAQAARDFPGVDLTKGYDVNERLAATTDGATLSRDPRLGLDDLFNPGFAGRFGVKFIF
jgi:carboxypeptidase family protein/TonB-dependent receptor-like protein